MSPPEPGTPHFNQCDFCGFRHSQENVSHLWECRMRIVRAVVLNHPEPEDGPWKTWLHGFQAILGKGK